MLLFRMTCSRSFWAIPIRSGSTSAMKCRLAMTAISPGSGSKNSTTASSAINWEISSIAFWFCSRKKAVQLFSHRIMQRHEAVLRGVETVRRIDGSHGGASGDQQAFELIAALNGGIDTAKPWTLKGAEKVELLGRFAESLRHAALLLLPFIPETAQNMSAQLGVPYAEKMLQKDFVISEDMRTFGGVPSWKTIGTPAILFAPLS